MATMAALYRRDMRPVGEGYSGKERVRLVLRGMDAAERIEAAKARLEAGRSLVLKAKEAGPPCKKCRYFVPKVVRPPDSIMPEAEDMWFDLLRKGGLCSHPALAEHVYSHISGDLRSLPRAGAFEARQDHGLCGPEALLFEKQSALKLLLQG